MLEKYCNDVIKYFSISDTNQRLKLFSIIFYYKTFPK